ncbi:tyrosine-type recombinase/integrase [Rubrivivax benzoatilyticus]|uniref:Tyrosine-type recombinase/integrase n=1 Tax=Rubrivivax benzoatilyticus TaxID=316997 RepID=A0ABX0I027_9BURK|nr:tyrosine-type recombinase/integrase [Rubrivivax benzoatilyticus]EGJ12569.1 integrase family protein [Rubrivivax benzoatilyticus JA2 = ATCC BAA-35]NHK98964.1 tyrosine-type recombinase/integrase [Rubrivivax benzoatilyticus]NHL25173.1 tyrosine-type recombinase/integrase [Rubrivivax benzoatilyticus]
MSKDPALPARVFAKGACYYLVVADGKKRVWNKLSKVRDGLPAMYTALAKMLSADDRDGSMAQLIADWEAEVMVKHSAKTQIDERARGAKIAARFADFQVVDVTPPDVVEFLKPFRAKPRTFNLYRAQIGELMRFAIEKGLRDPGTNPVTAVVRTMSTPPRKRCPTTSELRRVKIGCLYGDDGKRTRSGLTMACLIELAYLTGQDVSVMIRLRDQRDPLHPDEPHVHKDGVFFRRDKTGNAVLVEWTPRLRAVIAALRRIRAERRLKRTAAPRADTAFLFTRQSGEPLTYSAVANAWQEGIRRSKVLPFMFRDIRARALTDTALRGGMRAANAMGTHTTEAQTADYVRSKTARKTRATA